MNIGKKLQTTAIPQTGYTGKLPVIGKPKGLSTISSQAGLDKVIKGAPVNTSATGVIRKAKPKFNQENFIKGGGVNTSRTGVIRKSSRNK